MQKISSQKSFLWESENDHKKDCNPWVLHHHWLIWLWLHPLKGNCPRWAIAFFQNYLGLNVVNLIIFVLNNGKKSLKSPCFMFLFIFSKGNCQVAKKKPKTKIDYDIEIHLALNMLNVITNLATLLLWMDILTCLTSTHIHYE